MSGMQADLRFRRNDLVTCGTNSRGCAKVYPPGKKSRQKVAIGDNSGIVQVVQMGKHHDVKVEFATPKLDKPISRIDLFQDQLFTASGAKLNAYSKKGKAFFGFESNLTEAINSLKIDTPYIFTGGDYVLTVFQESSELGFYMAPDRINDLVVQTNTSSGGHNAFIGCQDRTIRSIKDHKSIADAGCEGSIVSLAISNPSVSSIGQDKAGARELVYGTLQGTVGAFTLGSDNNLTKKYSAIPNERLGSVTAVHLADINGDGVRDVVLGRDDGKVEVHTFSEDPAAAPKKAWEGDMGECINSLGTGMITNTAREEMLVCTYSGKVVTFSFNEQDAEIQSVVPTAMQGAQEPLPEDATKVAPKKTGNEDPSGIEITAAKVKEVQAEINNLRSTLKLKQQEFSTASTTTTTGTIKAISSEFVVRDKFVLDSAATLTLQIYVDTPLDFVALQADVNLDIIDTDNAVISVNDKPEEGQPDFIAEANNNKETKMLCTLRAHGDDVKRIEVRFRSVEGQYGTLRAMVVPKTLPRTAQMRSYTIRPLALHQRVGEGEVDAEHTPLSTLRINGNFSIKDAHSWVYQSLPEVPEIVQGESAQLTFKNTFQGTILCCRYTRGEAEFKSENLSTLAVLKECITKEATIRKIAVKIASEPRPESISVTLQLLHPLVEYQYKLTSKLKLIEALKEIEGQETDTSFLSEDYQDVLQNAKEIEAENKLQPKRMEYLRNIVERLLFDRAMFRGEAAPHSRLERLRQLLDQYDPKQLHDFFML